MTEEEERERERKVGRRERKRERGWGEGKKERTGREMDEEGEEKAYGGRKERAEKGSAARESAAVRGRWMKGELCRRRKGPQGSSGIF